MPLSHHPLLRPLSAILGSFALAFGLNAIFNPAAALSLFNFQYPDHGPSETIIDTLLFVYGVRDIFMGFSIMVAAWYGNLRVLGWLLVGSSAVAGMDGVACRGAGVGGEWNHWGFMPVGMGVGVVALGWFD